MTPLMPEIELKVNGAQGSGKSILLSLIGAMLVTYKIPFTIMEDEHIMKINMNDFIKTVKK